MYMNFWTQLSEETLTRLLKVARQAGANDEEQRIWDALCEKHGYRCDLCRICRKWNRKGFDARSGKDTI